MLYEDAPYVVTFYYDDLEAYRTDRFTSFKPQPDPKRRRWSSSTAPTPTERSTPVAAEGRAKSDEQRQIGPRSPGSVAARPSLVVLGGSRVPVAGGVGRRTTGSSAGAQRPSQAEPPPSPARAGGGVAARHGAATWPARSLASRRARCSSSLVFNFFLFRVLPGDPAKR